MGRREEAARHFEYAIEMNTALEARPYLAHTQRGYARMPIHRDAPGDREPGRELLAAVTASAGR